MPISAEFITQTFIRMIESKALFKFSSCSNELYIKGYSQNFKMKKIENAIKAYANNISAEDVLVCLDATLMGSAKNGFILTEDKMYWDGGALASKGVYNFGNPGSFELSKSGIIFNGKHWVTTASLKQDVLLEGLRTILAEGATNASVSEAQQISAGEAPATDITKDRAKGTAKNYFKRLLNTCNFFESDKALKNCYFLKGAHEPLDWEKKAQNAVNSYANGVDIDDILFLYDASITGNGKSGYLVTTNELIWNTGFLGSKGRKSFKERINFLEENNSLYFQVGDENDILAKHIGVNVEDLAWTLSQLNFIPRFHKDYVYSIFVIDVSLNYQELVENYHDEIFTTKGLDTFVNLCKNVDTFAKNSNKLRSQFVSGTTIREFFANKADAEAYSSLIKEHITARLKGFSLNSVQVIHFNMWEQKDFDFMLQLRTAAEINFYEIKSGITAEVNKQKEIEQREREIAEAKEQQRLKEQEILANEAYVRSHDGIFVDERDGNEYSIVNLGGKVWMAQNFRYKSRHSKTIQSDSEYWDNYGTEMDLKLVGRLYNWEDANQCAPEGWRLATKKEWEALLEDVREKYGYNYISALFHKEAWIDSETCQGYRGLSRKPTNASGFGLMSPGYFIDGKSWCWLTHGTYWIRNQFNQYVDTLFIGTDDDCEIKFSCTDLIERDTYFSVRYVKDNENDEPLPPVCGYRAKTKVDRDCEHQESENKRHEEVERHETHREEETARRESSQQTKTDDLALDERRIRTARIARAWFANPDVCVNLENDLGETLHINLGKCYEDKPHTFDSSSHVSYYWGNELRTYSAQELAKKYGRSSKLNPTNWRKK